MSDIPEDFPTHYWHKLSNDKVQCDLCPHNCKLNEGQRGLCFVRMCKDDAIVLTTYGRSSGFCVDPIEKKPLNHFLPGSSVFSFGTAGCNLSCKFCQNWDISKSREMDTLCDQALPQDIVNMAKKQGCESVAFTYNEPTIFFEYAVDVAKECRKAGIKTVAVTNGYINAEPREEFYRYIDAANVDLKGFTEEFYGKVTGSHLQPVLDTLIYLKHETNVWLEITTLLIPGLNDSDAEIDAATKWVVANLGPDVPMHFTVFHPAWKMLDVPPTPLETVQRARAVALANGVRYAYTGNVFDSSGASTFCHSCDKLLIARDGYLITEYNLDAQGNCQYCATPCAGVFAKQVGSGGVRRKPVRIS
ncbi:MAG: AmmeMemoRadiSam system radical SAM enzyme [Gammaproteobacteria bacterium]|nr:AmmeMemoRadiSam system radical SAM enzyme [Gammaproteobacteria bacterium]